MNPFKEVILRQGNDGRVFILHWKYRYGPLLAVAATGLMAYGQIQQGQAAEAEEKSASNIANYNAQVQEREAQAVEQRTALEQRRQAEAASRQMGTLRANLGAGGAVMTSGSPLMIQAKQASESELENLMIGYEGRTEASRARSAAEGYRLEGKMAKQRGKAAKRASYIGAGTTLLSGFSKAGGTGSTAAKSAGTSAGKGASFGGFSAATSKIRYGK